MNWLKKFRNHRMLISFVSGVAVASIVWFLFYQPSRELPTQHRAPLAPGALEDSLLRRLKAVPPSAVLGPKLPGTTSPPPSVPVQEAVDNPPELGAVGNPPEPGAVDNPPALDAVVEPPEPGAVDNPPEPGAVDNPPEPGAVDNPPEPGAVDNPPALDAVAEPPVPKTGDNPLAPF